MPKQNDKTECSILVTSCDSYADLWTPYFKQFWTNWPDCPYPVFLSTNCKSFDDPRVTTLNAGSESNWTNQVRRHLELLETPYVLMSLEDFFLRRPVPTARVQECLRTLTELGGHTLRLVCRPGPNCPIPCHSEIGSIDCGAPYRVSTQAAIWNRQSLLSLMRTDESIWDFEIKGSERSRAFATGFYGVRRDVLTYGHHVVDRGKWFPWEAKTFGRSDIGCDFEARPIMTTGETARWCAIMARSLILNAIPWRLRLRLVATLKSLGGHAE